MMLIMGINKMPQLFIISGCNGAGKTTASYTVLPEMLDCKEFVNADSIAAGLSPFNPEGVAVAAGRIMLKRIEELMSEGANFAFETTLATRSYTSLIKRAQSMGYLVTLVYFWLNDVTLAKQRVAKRVSRGGHNIPVETIERRYYKGIKNFHELFYPICDYWLLIDNSNEMTFIAEGEKNHDIDIKNVEIWNRIISQSNANKF